MIGNDVVDLRELETADGARHPRFDERVFDASERRAIAAEADRMGGLLGEQGGRHLRWIFWAAKESAFKAAKRLVPSTVFAPSRIAVRSLSEPVATPRDLELPGACPPVARESIAGASTRGLGPAYSERLVATADATVDGRRFAIRLDLWPDAVHAIATVGELGETAFFAFFRRVPEATDELALGRHVRALVRDEAAALARVAADEIEVESRGRLPELRYRGNSQALEVSLSHHGRVVAAAMVADARFASWSHAAESGVDAGGIG